MNHKYLVSAFVLAAFLIFIALALAMPVLTWVSPSPGNNTFQSSRTINFNVTSNETINATATTVEWRNQSGVGSNISVTVVAGMSNGIKNYTYGSVLNALDGQHIIVARIYSNQSNTTNTTYLYVNVFWNLTTVSPTPVNFTNQTVGYYYINVTSSDPINNATVEWRNESGTRGNISMTYDVDKNYTYINITNMLNGTHMFIVWVNGSVTDMNHSLSMNVTVDNGNPTSTITIPLINNTNMSTNEVEFTLTDNVATNLSYVIFVNNTVSLWGTALNNTATRRNVTNMTNGSYYINIAARDWAGNAVNSTQFNITVDTMPPYNVSILAFYYNTTYSDAQANNTRNYTNMTDSIPEIEFNLSDNNEYQNISYIIYVNDVAILNGSVINKTMARHNLTKNTIGLLNGTHRIIIEARDPANNRANSSTLTITVDTLAPSIIISTPANNSIYGRNISLSYVTTDAHTAPSHCWYTNGTSDRINLTNCQTNITFFSLNKNSMNNITFYMNDTVGNANNTGAIFFNSSTFQLYLNIQNSSFNNVPNVTVTIAKMAMGPSSSAVETWNGTTANGRTDVNGNITIDNLDATWGNPFQFTIKGFNGTIGDSENATFVGPILPPLPGNMVRSVMNATTLYLVPAANIRVTASNSTHDGMPFRGEVFDAILKFPIASFSSSDVSNYTVSVPNNRNYTVTVFRVGQQGSPPNSVSVTDANLTVNNNNWRNITAAGGSVPVVYLVNMSMEINFVNFTGYLVNGSNPTQPWNASYRAGMTFESTVFMSIGGQVAFDSTMPTDMGHPGYPLMLNLTTNMSGIFNIPLIANRSYVIAVFANDSSNYYAGFINVSLPNNTLLGAINISMFPLAGAVVRKSLVNASMINFSLVDGTNASNITSAGQGHIEVNATYPTGANTNLSISWMLDSDTSGNFQLYLFDNRTTGARNVKIKAMSNKYSPREYDIKTTNLYANSTINITMKRFSMESTGGAAFAGISVYFLVSNSTCNVPQPSLTVRQSGGCLVTSANSDSFNPLTIMTGGKMTIRMVQSNGITLQYENVDMMASGPPDAAYDSTAAETAGVGSAMEQVWKFGSMGPKIYDRVLIGIPYSDSAYDDSQSMKMKLRYLYDQDWNPIWNMSTGNSTNDLPIGFEDYGATTYQQYVNKSDTGMSCSKTDASSTCFVNTSSNMIWFWLPHFSGSGPVPNGTGNPPSVTSTSYDSVSLSGARIIAVTNEAATCKYSSTNVAYDSMNATFSTTGTTSHSQALSGLSSGTTYTYYIRCMDSYNNKMLTSASVVFTTSSGGGSSGGGGGGSGVEKKETHVYTEFEHGVVHKIKMTDPDIGLKQIIIEINNKARSVEITISKYSGQPASVTHTVSGTVYQYIEIGHKNIDDSNVKTLKLRFNVTKSWLTTNGFADSEVSLLRYNSASGWTKLTTTKIGENSSNVEYEADSPGMSIFAISAVKAAAAAAVCGNNIVEGSEQCDGTALAGQTCVLKGFTGGTLKCKADCTFDTTACTSPPSGEKAVCGNSVCETGETPYTCSSDCGAPEGVTIPYWAYVLIVVIVLVGVGGYIYYYKMGSATKYKYRR